MTIKGHGGPVWGDEVVLHLGCGLGYAALYAFDKVLLTVHLKRVSFTLYKLDIYKPHLKKISECTV